MVDAGLLQRVGREALLLPYQQRLLATTAANQVVVCEKSRRIGFTWGIAADAVLTAAAEKAAGGMDVFYLAYEKEMTREFIDTCADWARMFGKAASKIEESFWEGEGDKQVLAFRIVFDSGFEIVALSSKPRGLRGRQGYVIIDEAAFHDQLDEVLKAALALLIWGGKVLVISTHNGIDNPYNQLVEDARAKRKPYALVTVTLDDALADGLYRRICLVRGIPWSAEGEAEWRAGILAQYGDDADEELFCIPSQGAGSWIPPELIAAASHPDAGKPELRGRGACYLGNDIARRGDRWVSVAGERVGAVIWVREERVRQNITFAEQDRELDEMVAVYRPVRLGMDQTGMGEKPVEDAKRRYGEQRVEGVLFSGDRPLELATAAKRAFEDGLVRIPDDPDYRADIRKIKRVLGPTGAPRLQTGRDRQGHADRAWALFMMLAAAAGVVIEYDYEPAPRTRKMDEPATVGDRMRDRPGHGDDDRGLGRAGAW